MTALATRMMVHRLLNQYSDGDRLIAMLEAIGKRLDETDTVLYELLFGRFLDTAVGVHLDRIGAFLGIPRGYTEQTEGILTFKTAGEPYVGAESWGFGKWASIYGLFTNEPWSDDEYRRRIRIRARARASGASIPEIYTWIVDSFGIDCVLTVPAPMSIYVEVTSGSLSTNDIRIIENESPALPGVEVFVTG